MTVTQRKLIEQLTENTGRVAEIQNRLIPAKQSEVRQAENNRDAAQRRVDTATREVNDQRQVVSRLESDLRQAESSFATEQAELDRLQQDLNRLYADRTTHRNRIAQLNSENTNRA